MTEPVIYMRGFPPHLGRPIPESLLDDAKQFLSLDETAIATLCSQLAVESGFLTFPGLRSAISEVEIEGCEKDVVYRILRWASGVRKVGALKNACESLAEFTLEGDETPVFSPDDIEKLEGRINRILAATPSLDRQAKAVELDRATGQRLQEINLVCDLRPVFDAKRENIDGLLPITTIRLVAEGADGLPVSFEATMSEGDVSQLCDVASRAKQKLARLHELADSAGKPVPSTALTKSESDNA